MDIITKLPHIIDEQITNKIDQNNLKDINVKNEFEQTSYYLSGVKYNIRTIPPSQGNVTYNVEFKEGTPVVKFNIDHNFKDLTGHDIGRDIIVELYRDLNEDGIITNNELISSIKLDISSTIIDNTVEKNKNYIYRLLYKTINGGQIWSEPILVSTFDNVVYSKPNIVADINSQPDIEVITSNIANYINDNNVNALIKVRKINDSNFDGFIIKFKSYNSDIWEDMEFSNLISIDDFYYIPCKNLLKQHYYQVKVAFKRKTGTISEWSDVITFSVGDIVTPVAPLLVDADNISTETQLKISVRWVMDDKIFNGKKFIIYRHEFNPLANDFKPNTKTLIDTVLINKQQYEYNIIDNTVNNNTYYVYEVFTTLDDNEINRSPSKFSNIVAANYNYDNPNINVVYLLEQYHFPIKVLWSNFTPGNLGYYIKLYYNYSSTKEILTVLAPPDATEKIISINDLTKENATILATILGYNVNNNFSIELGKVIKNDKQIIYEKLGYETFTINPRPKRPEQFSAVYDPLNHRVDFKWNKSVSYNIKGYEIRLLNEANYNLWLNNQDDNEIAYLNREQAWASGQVIANVKTITNERTTWSWSLPASYQVSPDASVPLYFLIKTVGDIFINTKLNGDIEKIIYSKESNGDSTSINPKLPAPIVDVSSYTSAILEGDTIKLTWSYDEALYRQVDHFEVYMSVNNNDLNTLNSNFKVWSGLSKTCILSKDNEGNRIKPNTRYYFRIVAVDRYGVKGTPSVIFSNYITNIKPLPKPMITGVGNVSPVRIVLNGQNYAPLYDSEILSFFKHRTVQFVIPESFVKAIHVYAIKWYVTYDGINYIPVIETPFPKDIVDKQVNITDGVKQVYTFPTDMPYLRIKATQVRIDGSESNLQSSEASDLAIIDTTPPVILINKVVYKNDETNAINKNNYINRNVLYGGIKIYYEAYDKDLKFPVSKVEYSINDGDWQKVDLKQDYFIVSDSQLGPDTDNNNYRDITIKLRAYDIAGNSADTEVKFRKDTEGVPLEYRPTNFKYTYSRKLVITWVNNKITDNRNIYDGVKIFIGPNLTDAKEYHIKDSEFVYDVNGDNIDLFIAITDIADNYIFTDFSGNYYIYPYKITISNAPPKAPEHLSLESVPSGFKLTWDIVNKDVNDNNEDVKHYVVQYGIGTNVNTINQWINAGVSYTNSIEVLLNDVNLDFLKQNPDYNCYARVKAVDWWGLESSWSTTTDGVKPRFITIVDMSNNVFDFELKPGPYITVTNGNINDILDADYANDRFLTISNSLAYEGYLELNLKKGEWIPNIKLKFYYPHSTINFFIEYKTRINNVDSWGNYLVTATGNSINSIEKTNVKPSPSNPKYFSYTPNNSTPGDIAVLSCDNIVSDKRPLFILSLRVYFVTTGSIKIVEIQPVIESMANIFYGSELNLDDMISIRSKRDVNNYVVLNKNNLTFYGSGNVIKSRLGEITTNTYGSWLRDGVYIGGTNYSDAPIKIESGTASITLGGFYSSTVDTLLGSSNSRLYASPSGISIVNGGISSNSSSTSLGSGGSQLIATASGITITNGGMNSSGSTTTLGSYSSKLEATATGITITNGGISSNSSSTSLGSTGSQLIATASGIVINNGGINSDSSGTFLGNTGSQLVATSTGITITQKYLTSSWASWSSEKLSFGTGSTVGSNITSVLGRLDSGVYGTWLKDGVFIGGTNYSNALLYATPYDITIGGANSNLYITNSSITITQRESTASWSSWTNENLRFGTGSTIGSNVKAIFGKLPNSTYGNWLADGTYIGGSGPSNAMFKVENSIIYMGYISNNAYNVSISASAFRSGFKNNTYMLNIYYDSFYSNPLLTMSECYTNPSQNKELCVIGYLGQRVNLHYFGTWTRNLVIEDYNNWSAWYGNRPDARLVIRRFMYNGTYDEPSTLYGVWCNAGNYKYFATGEINNGVGFWGDSSLDVCLLAESKISYQWALNNAGTGTALILDNNGIIKTLSSSLRYKTKISNYNASALTVLDSLIPVIYKYKDSNKELVGFIAEEVADVEPSLVNFNKDGLPESIDYYQIIALLVKAIKELKSMLNM